MNPIRSSNQQESNPIWKFIPLDQYAKPQAPTKETIRTGISGLKGWLGRAPTPGEPVLTETELNLVPQVLLDRAAPVPDWREAVPALNANLETWLSASQPEPWGQIVVGGPYSGSAQIISHWAQDIEWRLIDPPSVEQILAEDTGWLGQVLSADQAPVVIPNLEHCYLRHCDGLTLLRRLLDGLSSRRRRYVMGCDSWAWAFLSKAININSSFSYPLTLGALGPEQLGRWLYALARRAGGPGFGFRQADYGKSVLPLFKEASTPEGEPSAAPGPSDRDNQEAKKVTDFLSYLASFSFGLPGIAWAAWRHSLRLAPEAEIDETTLQDNDGEEIPTIWVKPWSQLKFPAIPTQTDRCQLIFILQMLLLHNGLTAPVLSELLPYASSEVRQTLYYLDHVGLVATEQEIWRVTPLAYPAVRRFLEGEGYLVAAI
ncbi:MAG: hypothetical protein PHW74_12695 [Desulfobacca sp.]|nr:hypothetical protein [Desulfobacca sp.]